MNCISVSSCLDASGVDFNFQNIFRRVLDYVFFVYLYDKIIFLFLYFVCETFNLSGFLMISVIWIIWVKKIVVALIGLGRMGEIP